MNPISKRLGVYNTDMTAIDDNENNEQVFRRELPIIDSLLTRSTLLSSKTSSPDNRERISLGGSSSFGELQWENEIINDEFNGNEHNGNDLEWDTYEEDTMAFHNQTEQLIHQIEELTQSTLNDLR